MNIIDKVVSFFDPITAVKRELAREALNGYDSGGFGKRLNKWLTSSSGPNAAMDGSIQVLKDRSRDLIRNNEYAFSAKTKIITSVVGTGIKTTIAGGNKKLEKEWKKFANTTRCDLNNQVDLAGIQRQVIGAVFESGEVLVRRIRRRTDSGLSTPMQLQIIEGDFLDHTKDNFVGVGKPGRIYRGIEFNSLNQPVAYHLYKEHPGENFGFNYNKNQSVRVPASEIVHLFRVDRPNQIRGVPWLHPVIVKIKDLSDYEDAQLVRQKIAACFAGFIYDNDPATAVKGLKEKGGELYDKMTPGVMEILPPGRDVKFSSPPTVSNYGEFTSTILHGIAVGCNLTYELLTGDYSQVNFSSARMSRIEFKKSVEIWQQDLLISSFLPTVWEWFVETQEILGRSIGKAEIEFTRPRQEMIDPSKEIKGIKDEVRTGLNSLSGAIRESGRDPDRVFEEWKQDAERLDKDNLIFDSDPRNTSMAGQQQFESNSDDEENSKDSED